MKQTSLPSTIAEKALARDKGCIFTGVSPTGSSSDHDTLVATWIFPPYLGYTVSTSIPCAAVVALIMWWQLSSDPWLGLEYHDNPDACDLGEFMMVTNTVSGCGDLVTLFFQNRIGIDVDVCIHGNLTTSLF